jgi:hypothetical protein
LFGIDGDYGSGALVPGFPLVKGPGPYERDMRERGPRRCGRRNEAVATALKRRLLTVDPRTPSVG